jgi:hypothetical protein
VQSFFECLPLPVSVCVGISYFLSGSKILHLEPGSRVQIFIKVNMSPMLTCSTFTQDLPNYAQHSVPIFSLPQEWLWCESWCGNATKARAKTIDLCNNPMTKEPKLQVKLPLEIIHSLLQSSTTIFFLANHNIILSLSRVLKG